MMNTLRTTLIIGVNVLSCSAFSSSLPISNPLGVSKSTQALPSTFLSAARIEDFEDIGYTVKVKKPLGVVFEENSQPYGGLRVVDIEIGSEGGRVGMKYGDQLLAVNGEICIGDDFDTAMGLMKKSPDNMELLLFKGPPKNLYKILTNRNIDLEGEEDEGVVLMDENYESPVKVEVQEDQGWDLNKAISKITAGGNKNGEKNQKEPSKKQGGGLFGMFSQETIQLDGDDASGTGKSK